MQPSLTPAPTNRPVLRPGDSALFVQGMPWWTIGTHSHSGDTCTLDFLGAYVTDDFGNLALITGDAYDAAVCFWYSHRNGQCEAAAQFEYQTELARQARERADFEAANTRALLRPEPIVVEIGEPHTLLGDVDIRVGPDARVPGEQGPALYRLHAHGNEPIWLTHAQLAAVGVAAQHLCRPAPGRRTQ